MFGLGQREREGSEWMRGLGLGFTNPVEQGECSTCVWVAVV